MMSRLMSTEFCWLSRYLKVRRFRARRLSAGSAPQVRLFRLPGPLPQKQKQRLNHRLQLQCRQMLQPGKQHGPRGSMFRQRPTPKSWPEKRASTWLPFRPQATGAAVKASPLAEKVAADLGIDLADVKAAHGRVLAEDLLRYIAATREKADGETDDAREEVKAMSGMRKAIAKNMQNSHMTSPTVTFNLGIDMTEMKHYREQLKAKEIKVSYTDLLVKFVAKALTEFPLLNCSVQDNKIIYKHYVNMGVAVALDNGLVVPNIVDADKKSLTEISAEVKEMARLAREGKLPPEKLSGGTFTITNLGMYGIESFSPIINQPEVAILGVNTMEDKVVVRNGEICIRPIMNLSLTADHRVVDGSVAAQFLQRVKSLMENPALILA